ncbi:hypothetical protein BH10PLA2_BH10PLA2_34290 [soil metagenome]
MGICTPVLGEIIGGLEISTSRTSSYEIVRHRLRMLACWPYEKPAALEFGRIFAQLRRIGRPMQHIDIQVAAIAFVLGDCTVVSGDSDLTAIPGLTVDNWSLPP